jgi:hypothetical protein
MLNVDEPSRINTRIALELSRPRAGAINGHNSNTMEQFLHGSTATGLLEAAGDIRRCETTDRMRLYSEDPCMISSPVKHAAVHGRISQPGSSQGNGQPILQPYVKLWARQNLYHDPRGMVTTGKT